MLRLGRLRALGRGFAVVTALTTAAGFVALHRAQAVASELVLKAGAAILPYEGATHEEPPRVLHVNGATLFIGSGATSDPPARVLEQYAARCRMQPLIAGLPSVLKLGSEAEAFLACLEPEREIGSFEELSERFGRALDSGDLLPLGELRLVWAEQTSAGARYAIVWTQGGLPWEAMFPVLGDAPGADVRAIPRPQRARRMLSIGHDAQVAALATYASALPLEATTTRYGAELRTAGFDVARMPSEQAASVVLHVRQGSYEALAFIAEDGADASLVTLVALDALDADDATAVPHAR